MSNKFITQSLLLLLISLTLFSCSYNIVPHRQKSNSGVVYIVRSEGSVKIPIYVNNISISSATQSSKAFSGHFVESQASADYINYVAQKLKDSNLFSYVGKELPQKLEGEYAVLNLKCEEGIATYAPQNYLKSALVH